MTYDGTVMSIIESLCMFQSVKKDITTSYCNSEWLVMENDAVWQCNDCWIPTLALLCSWYFPMLQMHIESSTFSFLLNCPCWSIPLSYSIWSSMPPQPKHIQFAHKGENIGVICILHCLCSLGCNRDVHSRRLQSSIFRICGDVTMQYTHSICTWQTP